MSGSSDRPTVSLPRAKLTEWKSWVAFALFFFGPPATGTAVLTLRIDSLKDAVLTNTKASNANTEAVNEIKLELRDSKVTERRLETLEAAAKKSADHREKQGHDGVLIRLVEIERRVNKIEEGK